MTSKQKTNLNIQLPIEIEVDDYHELIYLEKFFKLLNNNIKVKELSLCDNGKYTGLVYLDEEKTSNALEYREWGC